MAAMIDSLGLLGHHALPPSSTTANDPPTDTDAQQSHNDMDDLLTANMTDELLPYGVHRHLLQYERQSLHNRLTLTAVMIDSIPRVDISSVREIGEYGVWSLSSAKSGNGVYELRDNDVNTFWQSDGQLPHIINISFTQQLQCVTAVALYTDHKLDESYTPNKISVRLGKHHHTIDSNSQMHSMYNGGQQHIHECGVVIQEIELEEPTGWVTIHLNNTNALLNSDDDNASSDEDIANTRISTVQIVIQSTHQNGRDTHIRQCKIFGPRLHTTAGMNTDLTTWTSDEFNQYSGIR